MNNLDNFSHEVLLNKLADDNTPILLKNKISLYLSDKQDKRIIPILHQLILNPKYINQRGTFVHSLTNFKGELSFELAINLVISGNFEVAHEAFEIINSVEYLDGELAYHSYIKLSNALLNCQETWRRDLITSLLDLFI